MATKPVETNAKKASFLAAYAECGVIRLAAKSSEASARSHYRWMADDRDYVTAFEEAQRKSCKALEEEARRRAVDGWDEPVYQNGKKVGTRRRYSDTLLIFLMKGNQPDKFGDKVTQTHRGDSEAPVAVYQLPDNGRDATQGGV